MTTMMTAPAGAEPDAVTLQIPAIPMTWEQASIMLDATFDAWRMLSDEIIYGRGGSDQEGGMASATYAAKMMKDMGLIPEGYKIMVVGTVQEEDCDGMCWQYIYNKDGIKPEFVISTEPTDGGIYRGHRGRMEIRVDVHGTSCHGSAPDRGDNAIYKMADIITGVRAHHQSLGLGQRLVRGEAVVDVYAAFIRNDVRAFAAGDQRGVEALAIIEPWRGVAFTVFQTDFAAEEHFVNLVER